MARLQAVKSAVGLTNIKLKNLTNSQKKLIRSSSIYEPIDKLARKMGLDVDIAQISKNDKLTAHVRKTTHEHILDVPMRVLNKTPKEGGYVPVTKNAVTPIHSRMEDLMADIYLALIRRS